MSTGRDEFGNDPAVGSDSVECAAFEAALPDFLEGSLSSADDASARAHLAACDRCRLLVHDLDIIRARASALPVLQPTRDLWSGIDARLRAGTAGTATAGTAPPARTGAAPRTGTVPAGDSAPAQQVVGGRASRWFGSEWSGAAWARAAVLIITTALVTSVATRWWVRPTGPVREPLSGATNPPAIAVGPPGPASSGPATPGTTKPPAIVTPGTTPIPNPRPLTPVVAVSARGQLLAAPTNEFIYDQQIATLHQILEQRRGRLDPKTVAIIEKNLRLIDGAIAESKAALARDPANAFLGQQLDRALNTKLELLRTVALLPAQT